MSDFDAKQCQIIKIIPSLQAVKIGVRPFPSGTFSSTFCEMRVFINLTSPEMNFHHWMIRWHDSWYDCSKNHQKNN